MAAGRQGSKLLPVLRAWLNLRQTADPAEMATAPKQARQIAMCIILSASALLGLGGESQAGCGGIAHFRTRPKSLCWPARL